MAGYNSELYDYKAAVAGRVHRRRVERRAYPGRKATPWNTADYVRAYFVLNSAQPNFRYGGEAIFAYQPGEHTDLFQTLGRRPQPVVVNDGIEESLE